MAETVRSIREWLSRIPDDVEVGIDDGGLTLQVIDDPTVSHEPRCAKHGHESAECTCWKTAYYEIGGLPA